MEYRKDSEPVKKNTFFDRLNHTIVSTGRGFLNFLEGLLFLLIGLMPYILIIAVIYLIFFRKKVHRLMEDKRAKAAAVSAEEVLRRQNAMKQYTAQQEACQDTSEKKD